MPSPFPGMDPYLEGPQWESFHFWFMGDIADALLSAIGPNYVVRPQQRVYVECPATDDRRPIIPDAAVWSSEGESSSTDSGTDATATLTPVKVELAIPEPRKETFLTIRDVETMEEVTVIELLSPSNKRPGDGRQSYFSKRNDVLGSETHLVELDLLRGGQRLPFVEPPPGDYYALVSRSRPRPQADAYAWTVRHALPTIPIPLRSEDPDVLLALQPCFTSRYDRAGYDRTLNYSRPPDPPFNAADAEWATRLLSKLPIENENEKGTTHDNP